MRTKKEIRERLAEETAKPVDAGGYGGYWLDGFVDGLEWILDGEAVRRPLKDWHKGLGAVLWYRVPLHPCDDLPWAGRPTDVDWPMDQPDEPWATHFVPLPDLGTEET